MSSTSIPVAVSGPALVSVKIKVITSPTLGLILLTVLTKEIFASVGDRVTCD